MIPTWALLVLMLGLLLVLVAIAWTLWRLSQLLDARAFRDRGEGLLTSLEVSRRTPKDPDR